MKAVDAPLRLEPLRRLVTRGRGRGGEGGGGGGKERGGGEEREGEDNDDTVEPLYNLDPHGQDVGVLISVSEVSISEVS